MADATVHVRLPVDTLAAIDERAETELRSRSGMVKVLIARGLAGEPHADPDDWRVR